MKPDLGTDFYTKQQTTVQGEVGRGCCNLPSYPFEGLGFLCCYNLPKYLFEGLRIRVVIVCPTMPLKVWGSGL